MQPKKLLIVVAISAILTTLLVVFAITRISYAISNRPIVCKVPSNTSAILQYTDNKNVYHSLMLINGEDNLTGENWVVLYRADVGEKSNQDQILNPAIVFKRPTEYAGMSVVADGHTLRVTYPRSGSCDTASIY